MFAFTTSLVLFLLLQQCRLLVSAQMAVLNSLVQSDCLQPCYIVECNDLDPRCVCQLLAEGLVASRACVVKTCNKTGEENAFSELWAECLSRKAELGAETLASTMPPLTTASTIPSITPSTTSPPADSSSSTPTSIPDTTQTPEPDPIPVDASSNGPTNAPSSDEDESISKTPKGTSSTIVAVSIAIPIIFLVVLASVVYLFIRRRRKLQRLSINTFMDQSDANYPEIGSPLEVRKEKLPAFLNDLLQGPPTPPPPIARKSQSSAEDPFKDQYFVVSPVPEGRSGGTMSFFPVPAGRDRALLQPPLIPQSPKPTFSTPLSRGKSVLSVISEVSLSEGSPSSQSEMRIAYQELRREANRADRNDNLDWRPGARQEYWVDTSWRGM